MQHFWKCEHGLFSYSEFVREKVDLKLTDFDVSYLSRFDETNRGPATDITLDDVESRYLLLGGVDGSLLLYDTKFPKETIIGECIQVFPKLGHIDSLPTTLLPSSNIQTAPTSRLSPSHCLQWNPVDTGMFISASADKTIKLWDTNRLECVEVIGTPEPITWVALSPVAVEHNLVAVSLRQTGERHAVIIDPLVGAPTLSFRGGHSQPLVSQVIWSLRNSYTIITAGEDGRILFWDIRVPVKPICSLDNTLAPGKPKYSHEAVAHNGPVLSISHSPDGLHLFSWGGTGPSNTATLRLWALDTEGRGCSLPSDDPETETVKTFCSSQPRTVNFGAFCNVPSTQHGEGSSRDESPLYGSAVRMAVTSGLQPGTAWGASAAFAFVPVGPNLLVTAANSSGVFSQRLLRRHFAKIRACVWNPDRHELYTAGMDNNLHIWPLFPPPSPPDKADTTNFGNAEVGINDEEDHDDVGSSISSLRRAATGFVSF